MDSRELVEKEAQRVLALLSDEDRSWVDAHMKDQFSAYEHRVVGLKNDLYWANARDVGRVVGGLVVAGGAALILAFVLWVAPFSAANDRMSRLDDRIEAIEAGCVDIERVRSLLGE